MSPPPMNPTIPPTTAPRGPAIVAPIFAPAVAPAVAPPIAAFTICSFSCSRLTSSYHRRNEIVYVMETNENNILPMNAFS